MRCWGVLESTHRRQAGAGRTTGWGEKRNRECKRPETETAPDGGSREEGEVKMSQRKAAKELLE